MERIESLFAVVLQELAGLEKRMESIQASLAQLLKHRAIREYYTTRQLAELLGRKEYTVREWCRLGRIAAKKLPGGRGQEGEWRISHEELIRYENEGLLPPSPCAALR